MLQQLHDHPALRLRPPPWRAPPGLRLLLLHHGIPRLAALAGVLLDEGFSLDAFADVEEARAAVDGPHPPSVLLTPPGGRPMPGMVFARECLAVQPHLRVLYLTPLPWSAAVPLVGGERMLRVPCTVEELAGALRAPAPADRGRLDRGSAGLALGDQGRMAGQGRMETGTAGSRPLAWQRGLA